MSAQICPVCHGSGLVASDFYTWQDPGTLHSSSAIPSRQTCRTCEGLGIVSVVGNTLQRLRREPSEKK